MSTEAIYDGDRQAALLASAQDVLAIDAEALSAPMPQDVSAEVMAAGEACAKAVAAVLGWMSGNAQAAPVDTALSAVVHHLQLDAEARVPPDI